MSGSVNKVILVGHIGRDPEIRFNQSGAKIANFSLATSDRWTDKQTGEKKERTEWHRCVCFDDRLCDVIEKYVSKGSQIYVEGSLKTRKWTGNDGVEKYTTEVVLDRFKGVLTLLGGKQNSDSSHQEGSDDYCATSTYDQSPVPNPTLEDLDDDVPF